MRVVSVILVDLVDLLQFIKFTKSMSRAVAWRLPSNGLRASAIPSYQGLAPLLARCHSWQWNISGLRRPCGLEWFAI